MMNNSTGNIKISGSGSAAGGIYDEVRISGSGKVTGDVECNEFHTSGSSKVEGSVKTKDFRTSGSSHICGNLEAQDVKVSGSAHIEGNVKGDNITVSGSSRIDMDLNGGEIGISGSSNIGGSVHVESLKISGSIKIKGDCEAEEFIARGGFTIEGLLNAGRVDIEAGGFCTVKEIGGEKIEVREASYGLSIINKLMELFTNRAIGLKTDVIEGDDIYLEHTTAKVVRGNRITIGKGCVIDSVEYKENLSVEADGKVLNQTKVE